MTRSPSRAPLSRGTRCGLRTACWAQWAGRWHHRLLATSSPKHLRSQTAPLVRPDLAPQA
eukprot:12892729-Prorocentrum_lima.AAC.1